VNLADAWNQRGFASWWPVDEISLDVGVGVSRHIFVIVVRDSLASSNPLYLFYHDDQNGIRRNPVL
jgi:hypothetical protein